jgi:hypothetical protein
MVDLLVPSSYNIYIQLGNINTTARQHMSIPVRDTVAAITERIERSNNSYTMTFDRNAVDACANTGKFEIRPFRDFDGDNYWTVKKR